ncbi:MAG: L-cystine transporter [Chloroflexi bacterium]|nr:L-cystine transporter [Chloroflexota bacterium]OJV90143.1 MAG: L-cystine transporter [Chloroflexi bacterium 54-19]
MTAFLAVVNIVGLLALIGLLAFMQVKHVSFSKRVFLALGLGIVYGAILQFSYGASSDVIKNSVDWFNVVGNGYVKLLQMIIIPLILVSIISGIINLQNGKSLGKISGFTIGTLLVTVGIASVVGITVALLFGLNATDILAGKAEIDRGTALNTQLADLSKTSFAARLLDLLPANPFQDMTGARPSSTIAVVIFAAFIGVAALKSRKKFPEQMDSFQKFVNVAQIIVMRVVQTVLRLTPFGVLAIMTRVVATTSPDAILKLIKFVGASYVALAIMLTIHMLILVAFRLNPLTYLRKAFPVLSFAFSSRSSAATLPLTVETQNRKMGVDIGVANFAGTFGTSIGQNGCAGIYPSMLAIMIAPTVGINPLDPTFLISLVLVVIVSSFGIAGVGGGATFASLVVLSSMGLPVALAGLLVSVEPLIDMGRTAVNVSDSMISGLVTGRILKKIDVTVYNSFDEDTGNGEIIEADAVKETGETREKVAGAKPVFA